MRLIYTILATALIFAGCKREGSKSSTDIDSLSISMEKNSLSVQYKNTNYSLPSPHQATFLLKENNISFNPNFINPVSNASNYTNTISKALNLGIYGTDLGYLNIYGKHSDANKYYNEIKTLANELKILEALDLETAKKIEENINNSDSLIFYLSRTFQDIDRYLFQNERQDIGALIIAGGWIESLYIVSQYYLVENNAKLFLYLGEQKYPLDNLIDMLEPYYGKSEEYSLLIDDFVNLAYIFDNIDFRYNYTGKQTTEDNLTVFETETEMETFDETLTEIAKEITRIRKSITN